MKVVGKIQINNSLPTSGAKKRSLELCKLTVLLEHFLFMFYKSISNLREGYSSHKHIREFNKFSYNIVFFIWILFLSKTEWLTESWRKSVGAGLWIQKSSWENVSNTEYESRWRMKNSFPYIEFFLYVVSQVRLQFLNLLCLWCQVILFKSI